MAEELTVAVAQCPADLDGPQARLTWLENALDDRGFSTPDLVVLPELFHCGYNIGNQVAVWAEMPDGPFAASIAALANRHGAAILYGFAEKQDDRIYNSAQCIDRHGNVVGKHRKLLLPPGFERDHFTQGSACKTFRLGPFTVAILICYDVEFPENLRHVAKAGADLVVVPTALAEEWRVVSECLVPTRAFENGLFLCYANYSGHEGGVSYFGGSCIIAPDGKDLSRAGSDPEMLTARLGRPAVIAARSRLPYLTDRVRLPWLRKATGVQAPTV